MHFWSLSLQIYTHRFEPNSIHLGNASIIIVECVALRVGVVVAIHNKFLNLEIEGDSKVIINCYNNKK